MVGQQLESRKERQPEFPSRTGSISILNLPKTCIKNGQNQYPWERVRRPFLPIMASSSNQPNTTLYLNNLNDKVNKDELRSQLFALFTTYGKIIDIVASKSQRMRGQAFLVFTDLAGATSALRACEGMVFYDKPLVSNNRTIYVGAHWTTNPSSTSITQNQSHTRHREEKTPISFHPLPQMSARQRSPYKMATRTGK